MPLPFAAYARLQERAAEFVRRHAPLGPTMIVGGTRLAADEVARAACDKALSGVQRFALRELVYALSEGPMMARGLVPVGRIAREAITASIAARAPLEYLGDVARYPGFPRALQRTLEDLRLAGIERVTHGRTAADLTTLLTLYQEELTERGFADYAMRVRLARDAATGTDMRALLLLDVEARTTAERELLDALRARAEVVEDLRVTGEAAGPTKVSLMAASSESLECVEIARGILRAGVPFDSCAVLLRSPQRHGALVQEALERAGIPAWYASGARRPDLAGRAFLALLRCREENLSATRFAEYVSLGQVPREEGQSTSGWERRLREAAVVEGLARWESRLEAASTAAAEEWEADPNNGRAWRVSSFESLKGFALPVVRRLAALPDNAVWRGWTAALEELAPLVLRNPRSVFDVLEELLPLADFGPVTLPQVLTLLERHLMDWRDEPVDTRYGRVFVGAIDDARGVPFRAVWVPGLNEGLFPAPVREDPLLLDDQRRAMGMETSRDDSELLQVVAACAGETAAFSYARLDLATGRERVKSFFAFEVAPAGEQLSSAETRIGWSAPRDPMDAIDETEYDLAAIRVADHTWLPPSAAAARRAIRFRQQRWSTDWTDADGLGGQDEDAAKLLRALRPSARAWSASALEDFARCPYRFFLRSVQGLRRIEEPEAPQRMDPILRGLIVHRVLAARPEAATLDEVLNAVAAEFEQEHEPMLPSVWKAGVEGIRADLKGWLTATALDGWAIAETERAFKELPIEGGWLLSGVIDAIETHENGASRITDYKTGAPPDKPLQAIGGGESLQPMLYALAAEALQYNVVEARLAYTTLRANYRVDPVAVNEWTRRAAQTVLATLDDWMDKGFLPAAPRENACERCEFVVVCGPYEERRVKRKQQAELGGLVKIRGMR